MATTSHRWGAGTAVWPDFPAPGRTSLLERLRTSGLARRSLAREYERLLHRAEVQSRMHAFSAVVAVDHRAVLEARAEIAAIVARLSDGRPISGRGVSELRDLMSNGAGPIYSARDGQSLLEVLRATRLRLDLRT